MHENHLEWIAYCQRFILYYQDSPELRAHYVQQAIDVAFDIIALEALEADAHQ